MSIGASGGVPASIQMALLAKVLDAARPVPTADPAAAVAQAASAQALLEGAGAISLLA